MQQKFYLFAILIRSIAADSNYTHNDDSSSELTSPIGTEIQHTEEIIDTTTDDINPKHRMHNTNQNNASVVVSEKECLNGGTWLSWFGLCACPYTHYGRHCELHRCMSGIFKADGTCSCSSRYEGKYCEKLRCVGGKIVFGKCACIGKYFGTNCEHLCEHGTLLYGGCRCYPGYMGMTCNECKPDYVGVTSSECGEILRRRKPMMQSRFALSGLSLCLITIILLWISVVTRRRRTLLAANHFERLANERLLREQQRRLCDRRAVAVQVSRTPTNHAICEFRNFIPPSFYNIDSRLLNNLRASRLNFNVTTNTSGSMTADGNAGNETPPPEYCSTPQEAPPSYEEATQNNDSNVQRRDSLK